jgi:glycosyltransferase involved in cell wall biosynthesis
MNTPEISVIIPAYNAANCIADSITSVVNQKFTNWELIVVDDGSTDTTAEIAGSFLSDTRIQLIRQANKGVSAARNAGIRLSTGKFIAFLDADDYYLPDNLAEKYDLLTNNPTVDFVYCDVVVCDEKLNEERVEKGIESDNLFRNVLQWKDKTIPALPSNILVKTALMKEKFLFDENLSNCADRYMKILLSKDAFAAYIPKVLVKYRNTPGSMSKKIFLLERDELYILDRIKENNIIPENKERRKIFAKVYLMLSGSWYKAGKPGKSLEFALKALLTYPGIFLKFTDKHK